MCTPTQAYPTDLNDTEWQALAPLLPKPTGGSPRKWALRELLDAMFYVVRSGGAWRMLPHEYPPWKTVYTQFWRWRNDGLWQKLNVALVKQVRHQAGRDPQPSAAVIDSQSVKSAEGGDDLGVDVHKQVHGRKRHIVVDTLGLLLLVVVHSASLPDGNGGKQTLQQLFKRIKRNVHNRWCRLKKVWADGAYEDIVAYVQAQ